MATPWEQAEDFAQARWPQLKKATKNKAPTRPLDVLDTISWGWVNDFLSMIELPAWVFIYSPAGNGLYELADNIATADLSRLAVGLAKLATVKSNGGMVFAAVWQDRQLVIPSVALVRNGKLYIFDKPDGGNPPLTESEWDKYAEGELPN